MTLSLYITPYLVYFMSYLRQGDQGGPDGLKGPVGLRAPNAQGPRHGLLCPSQTK